jgi:hypothetical protein
MNTKSKVPDGYGIKESYDNTWIVLRHGFQIGDREPGATCGKAEFPTYSDALAYAISDAKRE